MPLWQTGYRPFFLGAGLWAIISMFLWFGILRLGWHFPLNGVPAVTWHAHEMVFGYSAAVVAGFLLTAVPNWTGTAAVNGRILIVIFGAWLGARFLSLVGGADLLPVSAGLDLIFITGLFGCVLWPVVRQKKWKQFAILAKVATLGAGNCLYYLGAGGIIENGVHYGLYMGFYLLIALILTLGRRVIPSFIERRLSLPAPLRNDRWVDIGSMVLFIVFWALQIFGAAPRWLQIIALPLLALHCFRLYHWHRPGIWRDPLLWVLFVSYGLITSSFAIVAAPLLGFAYSPLLALHLFAVGGIGLMTCGMMSRVSLGHSGRDIRTPPTAISIAFICIALAAIVRVFPPMLSIDQYMIWLVVSQWLWITGFLIFIFNYAFILIKPRVDGKPG